MEIHYHITATKEEWIPHYENTMQYAAWEETDAGITIYTIDGMQEIYETALDVTGLTYTKEEI